MAAQETPKKGFAFYTMPAPASSSYWEVKFLSDPEPNTVILGNGKRVCATSNVTFDLGSIQYEEIDIYNEKIFYIKNISKLQKITVTYIEDEAFTISNFHKKWIYEKGNNIGKGALHRYYTPNVKTEFAKTINVKKFASDGETLSFEAEFLVIPDTAIEMNFNWDDTMIERSINYQIVEVKKLEFSGKTNPAMQPQSPQ
jgi:hypothetical protein